MTNETGTEEVRRVTGSRDDSAYFDPASGDPGAPALVEAPSLGFLPFGFSLFGYPCSETM